MPVQVEIRVFAGLHKYVSGTASGVPFEFEINQGDTGYTLIDRLGIPEPEAFLFMVNGNRKELSEVINEKDRIGIFPPVGGG